MRRRNRMRLPLRAGSCLLLCCQAVLPTAAAAERGERLDYRVSYRGVFSLGEDMPIADLSLEIHRVAESGLSEARLEVSSRGYPLVESLYPIRYRFRSWTESGNGQMVGFAVYEQMREGRHRLFLRDQSASGTRRFDLRAGHGHDQMVQLEAGARPESSASLPLFDRLSLLQRVRSKDLYRGAEYRFPVTDGRERFSYRVWVEGEQPLRLSQGLVPAWKLRFDGVELDADGEKAVAHRPLYVWLSQAPGRAPLRIDARHAIGLFRIELAGEPGEFLGKHRAPMASLSRPPAAGD